MGLLADLFLRTETKKLNTNFSVQREKPKVSTLEENFNQEGFKIAPDLGELDEMNENEFEEHGGNTITKHKTNKKLKEYRELLFSKQMSKFDKMAKAKRLRECKHYNYFILLPDESLTIIWNAWMLFVTFMFHIFNPYRLAFVNWDNTTWIIIDAIWDFFFFIDIILTFFKAYYGKEFILKDKRKHIAQRYISGWLIIDVISILPLYWIIGIRDYWSLVRHCKMILLPKLMKFNRYLRLLKNKLSIFRLMCRNIVFSYEIENLIGLILTFFLTCHLIA